MKLNNLNKKIIFLGLMCFTLAAPFFELSFMRFIPDRDKSNLFISLMFFFVILFLFIIKPTVNKSTIFALIYLTFKSFQGGMYDVSFPNISISFLTFMIIFKWYEILRSENLIDLIFYLKKNNLILIFLLILSSETNYLLAGHALPLLFQNLSIIIILSSFFLMWLDSNKLGFNKNFFLILVMIFYTVVLYLRRDDINDYYQVKFIFFFIIIGLFFFMTLLFRRFLKRKTSLNKVRYIILLFIIGAFILIFSYSYLLNEYSGLLGRSNSWSIRNAVNNVMLDLIHGAWDTTIFGYGLGSSTPRFEISFYYDNGRYYGIENINAVAHSGLLIFYYEHGLLGVILSLSILYSLLKNAPNQTWVNYSFYKKYNIDKFNTLGSLFQTMFLFMMFILQNLVIINSIPAPQIFWNSGLIIHMLLFMITIRVTLFSKRFLDMKYK